MKLSGLFFGLIAIAIVLSALAFKGERRYARWAEREARAAEEHARDVALNAAGRTARANLDRFLHASRLVREEDAQLLVRPDPLNAAQTLWVSGFRVTDRLGPLASHFEGRVTEIPNGTTGYETGDLVAFKRVGIQDWALVVNGRAHGFFGVRALLALGAGPAVDQALLAADPVPDWSTLEERVPKSYARPDPRTRFLSHLGDPPEHWTRTLVRVSWMRIETRPNGRTVGYVQHTWVDGIEPGDDGSFTGRPVAEARFGQANVDLEPITFGKNQIFDWGFERDGLGFGFLGLREEENIPAGQKEMLAAYLSPAPLPAHWHP